MTMLTEWNSKEEPDYVYGRKGRVWGRQPWKDGRKDQIDALVLVALAF